MFFFLIEDDVKDDVEKEENGAEGTDVFTGADKGAERTGSSDTSITTYSCVCFAPLYGSRA